MKWTQFFIKSTKIGVFYRYGYIDITTLRDPCKAYHQVSSMCGLLEEPKNTHLGHKYGRDLHMKNVINSSLRSRACCETKHFSRSCPCAVMKTCFLLAAFVLVCALCSTVEPNNGESKTALSPNVAIATVDDNSQLETKSATVSEADVESRPDLKTKLSVNTPESTVTSPSSTSSAEKTDISSPPSSPGNASKVTDSGKTLKSTTTTSRSSTTSNPQASSSTTMPTSPPPSGGFHGWSFVGGILLMCSIITIVFVSTKCYKMRNNYNRF